jgi:poly(3-hydroxybutyrate) depolymerase
VNGKTLALTVVALLSGCGFPAGPSPVPQGDFSQNDWPISQVGPDGKNYARTYLVHVPAGVAPGTKLPVVLNYHPMGLNGYDQNAGSQMEQWADKLQFIAVHPDAAGLAWNAAGTEAAAGDCVGLDDVAFTQQILAILDAHFTIDRNRIFACGFSSGGMMTGRVAMASAAGVLAPFRIAAIGVVSAVPVTNVADGDPYGPLICPALAADPIPLRLIVSNDDPVFASVLNHGMWNAPVSSVVAKAHEAASEWAQLCGNPSSPLITLTGQTGWGVVTEIDSYRLATDAAGRSDVELDLFDAPAALSTNGPLDGHMWPGPGQQTQLDASQALLSFFMAHPRPSN